MIDKLKLYKPIYTKKSNLKHVRLGFLIVRVCTSRLHVKQNRIQLV